jgi:hypothetical protein
MEFRTDVWKRGPDRRRAQLVLRRRLDALLAWVPHAAARGGAQSLPEVPPPAAPLFDALEKGEAFTVWASDMKYLLTRIEE